MTETRQTTAVWVESVLETELRLIPLMVGVDDDSADIGGMDAAARNIAIRIDHLTAEVERLRLMQPIANVTVQAAEPIIDALRADIDTLHERLAREQETTGRLSHELAEARAYISTIIDAPGDYPAEESE